MSTATPPSPPMSWAGSKNNTSDPKTRWACLAIDADIPDLYYMANHEKPIAGFYSMLAYLIQFRAWTESKEMKPYFKENQPALVKNGPGRSGRFPVDGPAPHFPREKLDGLCAESKPGSAAATRAMSSRTWGLR